MKAVVQRVLEASVSVAGKEVARIDHGLLVFIGVQQGDSESDAEYLAKKTVGLRIFENPPGKMNDSVLDIQGGILAVPQFTLLGDTRHGRRPDFTQAASPQEGLSLYQCYCVELKKNGALVQQGCFREHMQVRLLNDGPVTLMLDSRK